MPSELLSIEKERNQDAGKEAGRQGSADSLGRVRKDGVCVPSISVLQATVSGLSVAFPRREYWSGLPLPSPGDLPDPGVKPESPAGGCLAI